MKVFVTKYALTAGIQEVEVELLDGGMCRPSNGYVYYHYGEWHTTREAAALKAEEMRRRKLAALHRQVAKIKGLVF